jgi:hypothetical protein
VVSKRHVLLRTLSLAARQSLFGVQPVMRPCTTGHLPHGLYSCGMNSRCRSRLPVIAVTYTTSHPGPMRALTPERVIPAEVDTDDLRPVLRYLERVYFELIVRKGKTRPAPNCGLPVLRISRSWGGCSPLSLRHLFRRDVLGVIPCGCNKGLPRTDVVHELIDDIG